MSYIPTKHGIRTRLYQLERFSTVDPIGTRDCIMLDGTCKCKSLDDCKFLDSEKEVKK